jgi:hypothetical protein
MRAILISILISLAVLSACTGKSERVYAEARKCAAAISKGSDCSSAQSENSNGQQSGQPQNTNLTPPPPATTRSPQSDPIGESRVYLDATESMKGFAVPQNNTFTKLIESLGYAMPGCRLYKYGMTKGSKATSDVQAHNFASEIRFSQDLRHPDFYDLDYNEDDILFNQLAQEEGSVRSVLITDGVYSARQSELQSEVVKAIDKWMKKGRFFGVLIFNSPFEGKLYSENKRLWLDKVKVEARPFYAFVFSPDEKGFRDLKEKLSSEFKDIESLAFSRRAVLCRMNPQMQPGLIYKDIWPNNPFYLQMYDESIFGGRESAELYYEVQCVPDGNYPVVEFNLEMALDAYAWQQNSFKKSEQPPQFEYKYPAEAAAAQVPQATSPAPAPGTAASSSPASEPSRSPLLKLTFRKDNSTDYSLYHLIFNLSSKSLQPIIRAISTEDDSQSGDADKTYRFYEFISALTTVHLQNKEAIQLPPPVFVALANK